VSGRNATVAAGLMSPVIGGPEFSDCDREGGVLRMELPLSPAEMVAALYDAAGISCQDLTTAVDLWREIAVTVACSGLGAVRDRAAELADPGNVAAPDWLAVCRERVAAALRRHSAEIGAGR
jgi:hypothetical protein